MSNDKQNRKGAAKVITVIGGSGFVGRHVVGALAKKGYQIRVAVRRPDLAFHLQPLGKVGQIQSVQANLRFPWSVERAIAGSDVVVNLVGIMNETGKQKFQSVNTRGAAVVANFCKENKIPLVHMSAMGAADDSASDYYQSKFDGEKLVHKALKSAIIIRPSLVFGIDDGFFNKFAGMAKIIPFLPLIGGGKNRFQPVYVGDVAKAVVAAVEGELSAGKIYELGGSEVLTFRQCMELMQEHTEQSRGYIYVPWMMARLAAKLTGWIPGAPVTTDQVAMMESDNVVSVSAIRQKRTLAGMGIKPKTLAAILPNYLVRFRPHGQFSKGIYSKAKDA